ncbi:MAG: SGNH/GDSL hydrolase family protein [Emcibacter sp.]|nr:SGNH/GDSL hydrolase family protein [Emcibacter sp.]
MFFLLATTLSQQNATAGPITDLFVFGDSLSENGNLQALLGPGVPPRFTNGPIAAEILAAQIGLNLSPSFFSADNPTTDLVANNYAFAGARARTTLPGGVPGLAAQTGTAIAQSGGSLAPDALYLIFIGGNDVADALTGGGITIIDAAVTAILTAINDLQAFGAENFLVVNAPDVGDTPDIQAGGTGAISGADFLVEQFNILLASGLSGIPGVTMFDAIAFGQNYISSGAAAADGITNFDDPCSVIAAYLCTDNSFFYADGFHVTEPVQAAFGRGLILAANVPEPAPFALLAFGLLGLSFMRKRKAS